MYRHFAFAALLAAVIPAHAGELAAYAGKSIQLGSIHGVVYYTQSPSGYTVVTTLADGQAGLPVHFVATLADDQALKISVPRKLGEQAVALEIRRIGDKLILSSSSEEVAVSRWESVGQKDDPDAD